jgi:23S rRNA pseudouridine2457 synthase
VSGIVAIVLFNKPFQVLTRFAKEDERRTLRDFLHLPGFHPAGRLDYDSEGLLLLTDDGPLQARLSHPRWKLPKTYFVQVEHVPDDKALASLRRGVLLNDGPTLPAEADLVPEPSWLWPRDPPIRKRVAIPTAWLRITIREGRNRQVRRMTAAVGHPTLRLIRWAVGPWDIATLPPGDHRTATAEEVARLLSSARR